MNKMGLDILIGKYIAYDFKLMFEERIPKNRLKSVSAFNNGLGGLFFDDEDIIKRHDNVQYVCGIIGNRIDYMDPLPKPHRTDNLDVLQLKVNADHDTSYYVGDDQSFFCPYWLFKYNKWCASA